MSDIADDCLELAIGEIDRNYNDPYWQEEKRKTAPPSREADFCKCCKKRLRWCNCD